MRGATSLWLFISRHYEVSTHAPHARSDYKTSYASAISNVSTHAPHARSDAMSWACALHFWFQLTLLMRGATGRVQPRSLCLSFNSRSSCEERPIPSSSIIGFHQVSTHAPHARSDAFLDEGVHVKLLFQLTLLMRGATSFLKKWHKYGTRFNSRSSCEERPIVHPDTVYDLWFQLTLLMRGATFIFNHLAPPFLFQLTLLMRGATTSVIKLSFKLMFQLTLLMRGATAKYSDNNCTPFDI